MLENVQLSHVKMVYTSYSLVLFKLQFSGESKK